MGLLLYYFVGSKDVIVSIFNPNYPTIGRAYDVNSCIHNSLGHVFILKGKEISLEEVYRTYHCPHPEFAIVMFIRSHGGVTSMI